MSRDIARSRVVRFIEGQHEPVEVTDELAAEEPLEIRIAGEPVSVTMRTPGHDLELTAGYLQAEGLLAHDQLPLIRQDEPNAVNVAAGSTGDPQRSRRRSVMAASCGLCGKGSIDAVHQCFPPVPVDGDLRVSRGVVAGLLAGLESGQSGFTRTGGAHAAGLFDKSGELLVVREDIGRHNAVDKVIGHALLRRLVPLSQHILLVSGRTSFEIVQKALGARIPVVAAVSAPSSLAVEFAEASGQTLIGFLRPGRWNVYAHPERIGP